MIEIQLTPQAITDLQEIRTYITDKLANSQAAERTVANIFKRIDSLAELPEIGVPLSSIVDIKTNYRFLVCGNYRIFYQFKDNVVYVLHVLYGRRDFMQILFGEYESN